MELGVKQEEQYWITALKNGDDLAFNHFFELHYRSLYYFVHQLIQNDLEAEDIVSDCFIKLLERNKDFDTAQNLKAFLYISSRNACLNHIKHVKRKTSAQLRYAKQFEKGEEVILNQIIEAEVLDMIGKEIEALPEKCRMVFKLIHFKGKKTDEIAEEFNLSVQTVRNHKTRALELLKASFLKKNLSNEMLLLCLLIIDIQ